MNGFGYLISQILLCLLLAAALGFLIGWLWRSLAARRDAAERDRDWSLRLDASEASRNALGADLDAARSEHATIVSGLEGDLADHKARLSAALEQRETLAADSTRLAADLNAARARHTESDAQAAALRSDLDGLRGRAEQAEHEVADLRARVEKAEQRAESLAGERASLAGELDVWRGKHLVVERAKEAAEGQLARSRSEAEQHAGRSSSQAEKIAVLERDLQTCRGAREAHERRATDATARIASLEQDLRACREQAVAAVPAIGGRVDAGALEALQARVARRDTRIHQLEQELAAMDKVAGEALAPDDLQRIHGVGPVLEKLLNGAGVFTFRQAAH